MFGAPLESAAIRLPIICRLVSFFTNSGGTSIRNWGLSSAAHVDGESIELSFPTFITESVPPPQRSSRRTCNAKYLGGASS